jgi:predicted GIY-YIG superfamily endonuclease
MFLNEIESAFDDLIKIGNLEKQVTIGNISLVLKTLTPADEIEIQKVISNFRNDETLAVEFIDVFRKETLSRAIVEINGKNLRDVKFIETDEKLDNGVSVKITKQEAVFKMLDKLPKGILAHLFNEMTSLTEQSEKQVESLLQIKEKDNLVEAEILENRANNLRQEESIKKNDEKTKQSLASLNNIKQPNFSDALKEIGSVE